VSLTVTTPAASLRLTTRDTIKQKLGLSATTDDDLFDALILRASDAIVRWVHRPFAREAYTEMLGGFGEVYLMLARTPIVMVSAVLYDSTPITDYAIEDADAGTLYRQLGWFWTAQVVAGLVGKQRWPSVGDPLPRQEEPRFQANYFAGYVLPSQDLKDPTKYPASKTSAGVSAAAADNSFNDSGGGFPPLLVAGDIVETSGFASAANNGRFVVTGTPTTAKIQVSAVLVNESAGAKPTVLVSSLPSSIEEACIEEVKFRYLDRQKAPHSIRERVAQFDIQFADPTLAQTGLCANAIGLLAPFRRAA
jgi:hypothetical protein